MSDYKLTIDGCNKLISSDLPRSKKIKYLQICFSKEENIETFCRWILPNAFTAPFADFHKEIVRDFISEENVAVAAPRGHGKSTLVGQGLVIWEIVNKRFKYGVYTSQNHEKSIEFLEPIRHEIKTNKRLNFVYPFLQIKELATDNDNKDRQDMFDISGVRIRALSFDKNIRGMKYLNQRPDRIWLDDIEEDQRVINPELRRKDKDKLNKQIIPSLDIETGRIKYVGTILHHNSLLVNKLQLWNGKTYRACELDEDGNVIEETILFPEMFTKERLDKKKHDIGTPSFQSEYLNQPVDDKSSLIKRKWVRSCFDENYSLEDDNKYDFKVQGVDFAFSDRAAADESAFVGIGKNQQCVDLCSFFVRKGMSPLEQFDYIKYLTGINHFDDNALEENSIGNMKKHIGSYDFPYTLFWTGASDKAQNNKVDVDEFEGKRYAIGKIDSVKRLGAIFERNFESVRSGEGYTFRIPYKTAHDKEIANKLLDETCSWALSDGKLVEIGPHPDAPMALIMAFERLNMEKFEFNFEILEEDETSIDELDELDKMKRFKNMGVFKEDENEDDYDDDY